MCEKQIPGAVDRNGCRLESYLRSHRINKLETVESSRRILPALTDGSTEIQHHQVFMDFEDDALPIFLQTTETL